MRCGSEHQSRDVGKNSATKGVGQAHVDFVDGESEFTPFVRSRNDTRDVFA